ncbi:hypothetical protein CBI38_28670 [Rhodococcus oxybenzonivorans]|uniref:Uncharacterized protein n=1 Tax=Rhodococcus oxybenzonivorans TaxID=1990687 RepID=A0A2S2C231_9NOCA|nr:hypothetical protein CBI38_28670 [Rhodococcus oxybenzonivorans]
MTIGSYRHRRSLNEPFSQEAARGRNRLPLHHQRRSVGEHKDLRASEAVESAGESATTSFDEAAPASFAGRSSRRWARSVT